MTLQRRNRQRGKDHERATAKKLGGKRVGVMGGEDVSHSIFSVECKSTKAFVGRKWMEQCKRNNKSGKIPVVVVHVSNTPHDTDLLMIHIDDLLKLIQGVAQ